MLENELNDAEPSGEERSGARSPQINTAEAAGPPPAPVAGQAGGGDAPAAKGRRRATRRPAKASGTDAAPPDAPPPAPGVASPGPDAAGPSAIRFASPAAEAPAATGAPARAAEPAGTAARAGTAAPAATGAQAGSRPGRDVPAAPGDLPAASRGDGRRRGGEPRRAVAARRRDPAAVAARRREPTTTGPVAVAARRREPTTRGPAGTASRPSTTTVSRTARAAGVGAGVAARAARVPTPKRAPTPGSRRAPATGKAPPASGGGRRPPRTARAARKPTATRHDEDAANRRRRRRRRRSSGQDADQAGPDEPPNTVVHVRQGRSADEPAGEVQPVRGSTRLEAKRQRRREGRDSGRRRPPIITESEFLARREAVDRVMVVRQRGERTQIGVLEDGVLVEHYVDKASHQSFVGNVYLGKVQNVLPSMEAAFVDIGKGRNAVLYAGEVNFDASGLEGESKRIESALKSGQSVLVQVTKDPVGHKGARLTSQVSLPGRYLVYVPGGSMMGISRKLPDKERTRLKQILKQVMPEGAGVIVRTAAEGASEEELAHDVSRLSAQWESIEAKAKSASAPELLYSEPDLTIRVVRDIFNEDFSKLVVSGDQGWDLVDEYVRYVAPHLADRLDHWQGDEDAFAHYRIDEQLTKALDRKVWLPSGGSLVIDNTEAMTVVDVNTGKFTGQGGNLEETVTRNNLEAAEEIVRQLRLRDVGGIIVIDFIDMVLESNRELVLRRLLECLARDRTKHQVAEVTSLGLVQMTRKRVGAGLLEAFSETCECCNGRGVIVSLDLVDRPSGGRGRGDGRGAKENRQSKEAARTARSPAAARPSRPRGRREDSGTRGAAPDEAGRPTATLAGGPVSRRRGARDGAAGDGAAGDGAGADGNGADGGTRRVRRAPPAPGRHPRAGPSRARQPAASRRVAGWLSVRRSGINRPGAGSAGAPGRGAWRRGGWSRVARLRGARGPVPWSLAGGARGSGGSQCHGAWCPWSLVPWGRPWSLVLWSPVRWSLVVREPVRVGRRRRPARFREPGALDGEAGSTPAPGDPGGTPAAGDPVVDGPPA